MTLMENDTTEFKELDRENGKIPESVLKTFVAFLNTKGGTLYLGIQDDGSISGIPNPDDVSKRLSSMIHDSILPNATSFIHVSIREMERKNVMEVSVAIGIEQPYYLAKIGLKPSGVYTRLGTTCVPVNEATIRNMLLQTSGKTFETSRCLEQELTFKTMHVEMGKRSLEFGQAQLQTLKMIGPDGLYTNLALLLSDQCPFTIKIAVFQGNDNLIFRDRKELGGSVLKQLNDAYAFLMMHNQVKATFDGLLRKDTEDYPEAALREALLNTIEHRDYLFSGSTIINVYKDHIEFISLGGLLGTLSMEAIQMGVSQSRNPNLASVFYRMHLVESYGTGIKKILHLYEDCPDKPEFKTAQGAFLCKLPNINEPHHPIYREVLAEKTMKYSTESEKTLILKLAKERGSVTRKEVEELVGLKLTKAFRLLKELCDAGLLEQQVKGKLTRYIPSN